MANSKKQSTKTETVATPAPVATAPAASNNKSASTKSTAKSASKKEVKTETVATPAPVATPAVANAATSDAPATEEKKGRRVVSKQSVYEDFEALIGKIAEEINKRAPVAAEAEATSETASKKPKRKKETGVPVKFLRSINKRLAVLQGDASKMMKFKTKSTRDNTKSGLMKPVAISEALYKFLKAAGKEYEIEKDTKYARVEITRKIHQYVKQKQLRKGEKLTEAEIEKDSSLKDFRVILPDDKLATLLGYDRATAKDELTYFRLPQYLKSHFISQETA